jgi:hypothetical protein
MDNIFMKSNNVKNINSTLILVQINSPNISLIDLRNIQVKDSNISLIFS